MRKISLASNYSFNPGWEFPALGSNVIAQNLKLGRMFLYAVNLEVGPDGKTEKVLFDQPLVCEKGGGVILIVKENKVGLIKVWRPVVKSQKEWSKGWPVIDLENVGKEVWECPRGFGSFGDKDGVETAMREGQEETLSVLRPITILGEASSNTASDPHMTTYVMAEVNELVKLSGEVDPNEGIVKKLTFFTLDEIRSMVASGEIVDQFTLSALALGLIKGLIVV